MISVTKVSADQTPKRIMQSGVTGQLRATQQSAYNLGPDRLWIGPNDQVTPSTGYPLDVGAQFTVAPSRQNEEVWGICGTGETADIRVIRQDS